MTLVSQCPWCYDHPSPLFIYLFILIKSAAIMMLKVYRNGLYSKYVRGTDSSADHEVCRGVRVGGGGI